MENLTKKELYEKFQEGYMVCPCCGNAVVEFYCICPICEWQNDYVQALNPDYTGGVNDMSLNEARKAYAEGEEIH